MGDPEDQGRQAAGRAWSALALLASFQLVTAWRHALPPAPPAPLHLLAERPLDLRTSPARALRRLPGIGAVRSTAIVRARWEHGDTPAALELDDLVGIGPGTVEKVRAALGRGPTDPLELAGAAPGPPETPQGGPPIGWDPEALLP